MFCLQGVPLNIRHIFLFSLIVICSACTTSGQLYYVDTEGYEKLGCDVEFIGMPSVDIEAWTHELAKQHVQSEYISKKEDGYIVANIDLGLAEINKCI